MTRRKTLPLLLVLSALLLAPQVQARDGHHGQGPRWDRYQHHDFRTRGGHGYRGHSYHHRPRYLHHDYHGYRSYHHGHGHHGHHGNHDHHGHHDHDLYAIIGGAILLHEILD